MNLPHLPLLLAAVCLPGLAPAQTPTTPPPAPAVKAPEPDDDAAWIHKTHTLQLAGKQVDYTSTTGLMPLRSATGDVEGRMFFTAYHVDNAPAGVKRPVTFVFNGGPGSASLWLHLGFVGPKRVKLQPDGMMPPPPYELVPNDESILPATDLVLIDPIGTGYSRPEKPEFGSKFWSVQGDIDSVGTFIQNYLTIENRWQSPVFVLGESYGGIRGSGLAQWLTQHGTGVNGLILVSPALNTNTLWASKANDQPFAYFLPTFAAAAWYHHKLSAEMEKKPVGDLVREVQAWVYDDYLPSLLRGSALKPEKRKQIVAKLASFTGLSPTFIDNTNLRISDGDFFKELLRDQRHTIGRFDARFLGVDRSWVTEGPDFDPSDSQTGPPFTTCINTYLRNELGYKTTTKYSISGEGVNWQWEPFSTDRSEALRDALHENPYTKLFVAMGYFDLACPMTSVEQTLNEMELDPRLAGNITRSYYSAGHMMYVDTESRRKLHDDVSKFIASASNPSLPDGIIRSHP